MGDETTETGEATPQERGTRPTAAQRRAAEDQSGQREPRFSYERLTGVDGAAIVEGAYADVDEPVPAGAHVALSSSLAADDEVPADGYTRAQIRQRVERFLSHEDTTGQEG